MWTDLEESCWHFLLFLYSSWSHIVPVADGVRCRVVLLGRKKAIFTEGGRNPFWLLLTLQTVPRILQSSRVWSPFFNWLRWATSCILQLSLKQVRYCTIHLPFCPFLFDVQLLSYPLCILVYHQSPPDLMILRSITNIGGEAWYLSECAIFKTGWIPYEAGIISW